VLKPTHRPGEWGEKRSQSPKKPSGLGRNLKKHGDKKERMAMRKLRRMQRRNPSGGEIDEGTLSTG